MRFSRLFAILLTLPFLSCASTPKSDLKPIPDAWLSTPSAPRYRGISFDSAGKLVQVPRVPNAGTIRVAGNKIFNADKELTPELEHIESFDVSHDRGEVVFSAKRNGRYDIGLVSTDGSDIVWVPHDPADELAPLWAPRGNKISFIVRGPGGDIVRTVHVPTATPVIADIPNGRVRAMAWEPKGDQYAVTWESPDASERVETMGYHGDLRRMVIPPAVKLDVQVETLGSAVVLRPPSLRYGEKLPLVLWKAEDPFLWSDARAALIRGARVAVAVVKEEDVSEILQQPWVDASRVFTVGMKGQGTSIVPASDVPSGRYRIRGAVVEVPPAVVESFAAGWVADQLKGTSPPNGSYR